VYVSQRIKDAVADRFIGKFRKRPDISRADPSIHIHVHISRNLCNLSLDSSGDSLHKRGYRSVEHLAPLNEVLAAGMVMLSGWTGQAPLLDPMCGSGTILIEAALIALEIPPGSFRRKFGFQAWHDYDRELFDRIVRQGHDRSGIKPAIT
jgi:putative N6-adenine-specific DNA methylase